MAGPLTSLRVVELAGIGPGPFAAMLLADMGAEVVRVVRPGEDAPAWDVTLRGRTTVQADLKTDAGRSLVLALAERADVLLEGFRPGVMERLGLGPELILEHNERLVYGRMTGYGQDGPMASVAGHDINYISIAGVLGSMRRDGGRPAIPLNLVGDYGGGGMLLALGVVSAVVEARFSGQGQVVDAAMVDGAAQLSTLMHGMRAGGAWNDEPGTNLVDGGAPFYDVYETADGRFMAVGAIEPQFHAELLRLLDLSPAEMQQWDRDSWPRHRTLLRERFLTRSRDAWAAVFEDADACVTPVLDMFEAAAHRHNVARRAFVDQEGTAVPAPAPRFGHTPSALSVGESVSPAEVLARWAEVAA